MYACQNIPPKILAVQQTFACTLQDPVEKPENVCRCHFVGDKISTLNYNQIWKVWETVCVWMIQAEPF